MARRVHHQAGARPHESAAAGEPPEEHGYLPPRLSQAEAIQEAALMSDRYERAFLRLVRAFRDYRRMFAALIVSDGGTLNVAEGPQQVNIDARSDSSKQRTNSTRSECG